MPKKEKYSLVMHNSRFDTEEKCREYLKYTWWNGKPRCPHCGNNHMNYYITKRDRYSCSKCTKQFSLLSGTIFHSTKIPLTIWFLAMYLYTTHKKSISSVQLAKWCDIRQGTAWLMLSKMRKAAFVDENDLLLEGVVQCDEALFAPDISKSKRLSRLRKIHNDEQEAIFGPSNYKQKKIHGPRKRGRKKGKSHATIKKEMDEKASKPPRKQFEVGYHLFGIWERDTPDRKGRAIIKKIGLSKSDVTKENLYPFLIPNVLSSAILYTDESPLYDEVGRYFKEHGTVKHRIKQFKSKTGATTNGVEGLWSHVIDVFRRTYVHVSYKHADGYIAEFIFRWNRREDSLKSIFEDSIKLAKKKGVTYLEVIESPKLKEREKRRKLAAQNRLAA